MVTQLQPSKSLGSLLGQSIGSFGAGVASGVADEIEKQTKVDQFSQFVGSDIYAKAPLDQKLSLTSVLFGKDVASAAIAAEQIEERKRINNENKELKEDTLRIRKEEADLRRTAEGTNAKAIKQRMIENVHKYADNVANDLKINRENRPLFKDLISEQMENPDASLSQASEEAARIVNAVDNYNPQGWFSGLNTPEKKIENLVQYFRQNQLPKDRRVYDKMAKKVGLNRQEADNYWRQLNGKPSKEEKKENQVIDEDAEAIAEATENYPPAEYKGQTGTLASGKKVVSDGTQWKIVE